jgi:hypothetical protein
MFHLLCPKACTDELHSSAEMSTAGTFDGNRCYDGNSSCYVSKDLAPKVRPFHLSWRLQVDVQ